MQIKQEVVVTGIGLISPLGAHIATLWKAILQGDNGINYLNDEYRYLNKFKLNIAGIASKFDFYQFEKLSKKNQSKLEKMDKQAQMLIYSALSAIEDAKLEIDKSLIGAIIGCGINNSDRYNNISYEERKPTWFFDTYPNMLIGHMFQLLSIKGYGTTIVNACCGSMQAIGEAYKKIQSGAEQIMLAGGTDDKINQLCTTSFRRLNMLSDSRDPESAMCPFDKDRNGFVMGQGACILVLESLSSALARGVEIYGKVVGYGTYVDATSVSDASMDGKKCAMEKAIVDAQIDYKQIGYINAHGTSTISNDKEESAAIKSVFKEEAKKIPISSTKSFIGHTFASCGAIQSAICLQSLRKQIVHKNRNFVVGDQDCDLNYLTKNLSCTDLNYVITNTSAIGGSNAALLFQRQDS